MSNASSKKKTITPKKSKNGGFLSFIVSSFKLILILALCFTIIIIVTDKQDMAKAYLTHSYKYIQLSQQQPPEPNSLPNPIEGAHLTDTWGAARSNGRSHEGIDIFAKRGTPIHSTTPGIVRKVGIDDLGGNVVSILGPGKVGHYYAHLDSFADFEEGDWVESGDIIGYVGDSGNAKGTPPHVHYGVYTLEGAVNPYPLLKK